MCKTRRYSQVLASFWKLESTCSARSQIAADPSSVSLNTSTRGHGPIHPRVNLCYALEPARLKLLVLLRFTAQFVGVCLALSPSSLPPFCALDSSPSTVFHSTFFALDSHQIPICQLMRNLAQFPWIRSFRTRECSINRASRGEIFQHVCKAKPA
jgi:hypothetical protein